MYTLKGLHIYILNIEHIKVMKSSISYTVTITYTQPYRSPRMVPLIMAIRKLERNMGVFSETKEWPQEGIDLIMVSSAEMSLLEHTFEMFRELDILSSSTNGPVTKEGVYSSLWDCMRKSVQRTILPTVDGPAPRLRGLMMKWFISFVIYMHEGWEILKERYHLTENRLDVTNRYVFYLYELMVIQMPKKGLKLEEIRKYQPVEIGPNYNIIVEVMTHVSTWYIKHKPSNATRIVFNHIWEIISSILVHNLARWPELNDFDIRCPIYQEYNPFGATPMDNIEIIRKG